jgi:HPr kinase/phosphorylase
MTASASENRISSTVHGALVNVVGMGILILGRPGIGKSACALELVTNGYRLIADDVVVIESDDGRLTGTAPEALYGLLDVRGLGICDIRTLFSERSVQRQCQVDVCVEFCDGSTEIVDPLEKRTGLFSPFDLSVPKVVFVADGSRNLSILVETTARYFLNNGDKAAADLISSHDEGLAAGVMT